MTRRPDTLESQRAEFASSPFLAMPIAGAIAWAAIGVAGASQISGRLERFPSWVVMSAALACGGVGAIAMGLAGRLVPFVVVAVVAVVGVIAAGVLIGPDISDARDRVDARWTSLRAPFTARYQALRAVSDAMHAVAAGERAVVQDLDDALARWEKLSLTGDAHANAAREAETVNELEALTRRLRENVLQSDRLNVDPGIEAALLAFDQATVPIPDVQLYNRSVRRYEDERSGAVHGLVAAVLLGVGRGFGETMAVLMASGHAIHIPTSVFDSVRALTATIAAELGETAVGSDHYGALFTMGIFLFVVTFAINLAADLIVRGKLERRLVVELQPPAARCPPLPLPARRQ